MVLKDQALHLKIRPTPCSNNTWRFVAFGKRRVTNTVVIIKSAAGWIGSILHQSIKPKYGLTYTKLQHQILFLQVSPETLLKQHIKKKMAVILDLFLLIFVFEKYLVTIPMKKKKIMRTKSNVYLLQGVHTYFRGETLIYNYMQMKQISDASFVLLFGYVVLEGFRLQNK